MKKLILSTAYLPPIDYFAAILAADKIFIEADESYAKQSYRNRCKIIGPNGVQNLSVPAGKKVKGIQNIQNMHIQYAEDWTKMHWKSLETAYNSSPFFFYYQDEFVAFYENRFEKLIDFNTALLELILSFFQFEKDISYTKEFHKTYSEEKDLRLAIHPKEKSLFDSYPQYMQVFDTKNSFQENLSIIDLLFNKGPESILYLLDLSKKITWDQE